MKNSLIILALLSTMVYFTSCTKEEEPAKPTITITELGHNNSGTAHPGDELHLEADIVAEGVINTVQLTVHHEGGHKTGDWEVDTTYTKFMDLKNATFHEHIDIDSTAELGDYHLHLIVVDKEGNQVEAEAELELVQEK
jgi:hypothetical protein